jgi:hypothetical protein
MSLLGAYGALIFECSSRRVHSYEALRVGQSSRWAQHDVHLEMPILEFSGPGLTEVNFRMNFNKSWGSAPMASIVLLREYCRQGLAAPLVTGRIPVSYSSLNLFVCTQLGEEHKWYDGNGSIFGAAIDVTLKEYRVLL